MAGDQPPVLHQRPALLARLHDAVIYPHLWLAIGAMAQRWWIGQLGPSVDARGILVTGAAVLAGYGYLRLVRSSEPDPIPSDHIAWVIKHRTMMLALVAVATSAALWLAWDQHLVFGSWSAVLIGSLALYLVPLRRKDGRSNGLRELPGLKVILVALGWTLVTFGVTNEEISGFELEGVRWMALMQFCYFLALAIAFDIGDLPFDRAGLRTIPQLFGVQWAKVIAVVLLIPWTWFLFVMLVFTYSPIEPGWREAGLDPKFLLPLFGMLVTGLLIIRTTAQRPRWFFGVLLDGLLLLVPLLGCLGAAL